MHQFSMHRCSAFLHVTALIVLLNQVDAAFRPPLGPVKAARNAAPSTFTDQLIDRCDVHYHDTILDHFDWVKNEWTKTKLSLFTPWCCMYMNHMTKDQFWCRLSRMAASTPSGNNCLSRVAARRHCTRVLATQCVRSLTGRLMMRRQRYFVCDKRNWKEIGPIFLYVGNEADVTL